MKKIILFLLVFISSVSIASAMEIAVPENQAKFEINGAICAYCTYGIQKSLIKMDITDNSLGYKGVEADIDNQIITLYLRPGAAIDIYQVHQKIKKGGYEPRRFHLRVSGLIVQENEKFFLIAKNQGQRFELYGNQISQLKQNQNYDIQILIEEKILKSLNEQSEVRAKIQKIFEKGVK